MTEPAHRFKTASWITVGLIVLAAVVLGFALILQSLVLTILGVVVLMAGAVLGLTTGIMDDAH